MQWLTNLIALIAVKILELLGKKIKEDIQDRKEVDEAGEQAKEAAEQAVSELTGEEFPKPDPVNPKAPLPIKEGKLPNVKDADKFLDRRDKRKRT